MTDDLIERMARAYCESGPIKWVDLRAEHRKGIIEDMRAALAAIKATHAIVPREPTEAIIEAGYNGWGNYTRVENDASGYNAMIDVYKAMIATAETGE